MIFKLFGELVFVDFSGFCRTRYRSELGGFLGFSSSCTIDTLFLYVYQK